MRLLKGLGLLDTKMSRSAYGATLLPLAQYGIAEIGSRGGNRSERN
jgi:hypothetical protein